MVGKHTPGPWYAYPNVLQVADKHFWFDVDGSRHGETPNMIIECPDIETTRLVAAAPDLLQSCRGMLHALETDCRDTAKWDELMTEAVSAIAKATGGQE